MCAALCIFLLLLIGLVVGRVRSLPSAAAQPTPALAPIILIATQPAIVPPTAVPIQVAAIAPNALRRAVVAYDSPNGSVIGAIEQGRAYGVLTRYGSDWLQADVPGSGVVWLRSADVLDLPADLADLQPTDAPQVVYVSAPAPAYAAPPPNPDTYQAASEPPPTPVWATSAPVRPEDFVTVDPKARCQFIGCL